MVRAIPLARPARRRHRLEPPIVGRDGTLDAADAAAARSIAARLTAARLTPPPAGTVDEPARPSEMQPVGAGDVAALAALDAVLHRLIEHERDAGRVDLPAVTASVREALGDAAVSEVDRAWRSQFRDGDGRRRGGPTTAPDLLAELLVLATLNEDPAAIAVRELVDDRPLRDTSRYEAVLDTAERGLGGRGAPSASGSTGSRGDPEAAGSGPARARGRRPRQRPAPPGTAARADAERPRIPRGAAAVGAGALVGPDRVG